MEHRVFNSGREILSDLPREDSELAPSSDEAGAPNLAPNDPLEEFRRLLGGLMGPLLRDAEGALNLELITAKDFSEFKCFLQDQAAQNDGMSFRNPYESLLQEAKYEPLLRRLWELRSPAPRSTATADEKALLKQFQSDLIRIDADRFTQSQISSTEGRNKLRNILLDPGYFNKDRRSDLAKAIAKAGKNDGMAVDMQVDAVTDQISSWNIFNVFVSEEEMSKATTAAQDILDSVDFYYEKAERIRKKEKRDPEQISLLAEEQVGHKITSQDYLRFSEIHQSKSKDSDPISMAQAHLAGLWLLTANNSNWTSEEHGSENEARGHVLRQVEALFENTRTIKTEQDFIRFAARLRSFLKGPIQGMATVEETVGQRTLRDFVETAKFHLASNTLPKLFSKTSGNHREPYQQIVQLSDAWSASIDMGERIRIETAPRRSSGIEAKPLARLSLPKPTRKEDLRQELDATSEPGLSKVEQALRNLVEGLEKTKHELWAGYKQHKTVSRLLSAAADQVGIGNRQEIRKANQFIDQTIEKLNQAKTQEEAKRQIQILFKSLKKDGVLYQAFSAAEMDGIEQALGLVQSAAIAISIAWATKGMGTVLQVDLALLEGAVGLTATQMVKGFAMGAATMTLENTLAVASKEARQGPETLEGWMKDAAATGLSMSITGALPASQAANPSLLKNIWARYAMGGLSGAKHLVLDTLAETVEEAIDQAARQAMDGNTHGLSLNEWRELASISALGGGAKVGAVAEAMKGSKAKASSGSASPAKSDWRRSPLITHPLGNLLMAPLGLFLGVGGGAFFGPQFKKKLTIDRKTLSEMEAFSRTKVKGDGEDHAVFFGLNHLKWWLSLVYRDIETLGARAIFQGGAILFARWQGKSENRKKTEDALTALAEEAKFSVEWKAPTDASYWQELWEKSRVEDPNVAALVLQQLGKAQAPLAQNWLEALAQNDFDRSEEIRKIMKGEEIRLSVASPPRLNVDNVDSLNSSIAKAYDKAWTAASLEETLFKIIALKKRVDELHFLPEEKLSGEPIAEQKPAAPIPVGRVSTALHPHAARFIELSFGHDKASSEQIEEWIAAEGPRLQAISRAVQGYIKKVLGVEGWERYFVKARRQWAKAAKVHSGSDIQSLYIARVISSLEDGSWVYQHPDNLDPWEFASETSAAGLLINQGVEPALRNVWNRGASEYAYLMSAHLAKVLAEDIAAQKPPHTIPTGPLKAPLHPLAATLINKVFGHDEASANKREKKIAVAPPRYRVIPRALQGYIKKTLGVEGWEQYFIEARSDCETATKNQSQRLAESHEKARLISSLEDGSWVYDVTYGESVTYSNNANTAAMLLHSSGLEYALKYVWDFHVNEAALKISAHLAKLVAELITSNNAPAKALTSQFILQPGNDDQIGADASMDIPIRNMGLKEFHLQENLKPPAETYFDTLPKRDLATIPEEFRHLIPKPKDIVLFDRFKVLLDETASLLSAPERIAVRFFGPPGTAKTTIPEMIAQQMGVPLLRFPFSKFTDPSDIDGQWNLQEINGEESVIFEEGPATLAMEHGFHLVWDEPDLARPGTLAYANNISAPGATAWVRGRDGNLRRIEVHPGFRVLATENGVNEIGRDEHGKDFLRRFVPYYVGPWTQEEVVEVLTQTFENYGGRRRWSHKVTETLALFHEQMRKLAVGGRDPQSRITLTPLGSGVGQTVQFTPRSVLRLAQRLLASGDLTAEGLARALRSEYILPLALEEDRRLVWNQVKAIFSVLKLGDIGPESIPQPTLESLSKIFLGGRKIQKNHFVWTPQDLRLADEILWNKSLGIDVMLLGEAGEGKTELPPQIAQLLQLPYFQKSISRETEESDLVGGPGREGKKIVFKPDVVTLATEQGGLLHLDECLLGDTAKIEAVFNPLMDGTQALILKHPYRMIPRHQDAFFVFTSNPPFGEFADRYEYSGALQSRMATLYLTGEFAKQAKDRLDILEGYLEGLEGNARSLPSATRSALRLSRQVGRNKTTLRFLPLVPNQVARDRFQVPELLAVEIGPAAIREIDAEGRLIPLSAQSQRSLDDYASYLSRRTQADMASSGRVFQISYSVLGSNLTDFDTRGIQLNLSHVLELPLEAALGIGKHEYAHALIDGPNEKYDAHPWGQLYANAVGDPRMHEYASGLREDFKEQIDALLDHDWPEALDDAHVKAYAELLPHEQFCMAIIYFWRHQKVPAAISDKVVVDAMEEAFPILTPAFRLLPSSLMPHHVDAALQEFYRILDLAEPIYKSLFSEGKQRLMERLEQGETAEEMMAIPSFMPNSRSGKTGRRDPTPMPPGLSLAEQIEHIFGERAGQLADAFEPLDSQAYDKRKMEIVAAQVGQEREGIGNKQGDYESQGEMERLGLTQDEKKSQEAAQQEALKKSLEDDFFRSMVPPSAVSAARRLKKILPLDNPTHMEGYFRSGKKLDRRKAMEDQVKPVGDGKVMVRRLRPEEHDVSVVMVGDISYSVVEAGARENTIRASAAAVYLAEQLKFDYGEIVFGHRSKVVKALGKPFGSYQKKNDLLHDKDNAFEDGSINRGTNIREALAAAIEMSRKAKAFSKYLILFTDGEETVSTHPKTLKQLGDEADAAGIRVMVLAMGDAQRHVPQHFTNYRFVRDDGEDIPEKIVELFAMAHEKRFEGTNSRGLRKPSGFNPGSGMAPMVGLGLGLSTLLDSNPVMASDGSALETAFSLLRIFGTFVTGCLFTWLVMKSRKNREQDKQKLPPAPEVAKTSNLGPYRTAEKTTKEFPLKPEDVVLEFHENGVPKRVKLGSERIIDGIKVHSKSMTWGEALKDIFENVDAGTDSILLEIPGAAAGGFIFYKLFPHSNAALYSGIGLGLVVGRAAYFACYIAYYRKTQAVILELFPNGQLKEVHLRQPTPLKTLEREAVFTGKVEFHPNGLVKRGTIARREVNFDESHLPPTNDSVPPELTESVEPRYRVRVQDTSAETEEDLIAAEEEAAIVAADEKDSKRGRGGMGGGPLLALVSAGAGLSTVLSATEAFAGVTKVSGAQGDVLLSLIGVGLTAVAAMAVSPKSLQPSLIESLSHTLEGILQSIYTTNKTHDAGIHHIATRPPMDPTNKRVYFLTLRIEGNELDLVAKKSRADIEAHQALLQFKPEAARHLPRLYATIEDIAVMERLRGLESSELEAAVLKDEKLRVEYIQQAWQMMKEVSRSGLSLCDVRFLQGHNIIYDPLTQNLRLIELGSLTKENIFSPEEGLSNLLMGESIQSDLYFDLLAAAFRDKDPSEYYTLPQWLQAGHPKFEEQAENLLTMMTPEEIDELHRSSRETWIVPFVSHAGGDYPMRFSKALIQAVVSGDRGAALEILKKGQAIDFVDDPQDPLYGGYLLSDLENYRKIDRKELVSIGGGFYRLKSNPHAAGNSVEGVAATQGDIGDSARRWRGPTGGGSSLSLLVATSAGLATLLDTGQAHASDGTVSGIAVSLLQILGAFGAASLVTWLAMKSRKIRAQGIRKLPSAGEGSESSNLGPYRTVEKRIKEFPLMPEDVVLEFHENGVPKRVQLGSQRIIDGIMVHSKSMTWMEALGHIFLTTNSDAFTHGLKLASVAGLVGSAILAMHLNDPAVGLSGEGLVLLLSTAAHTTYYRKKQAVVLEFFPNGQLKEVHLRQPTPLKTVEGEAVFTGKVEFHPNGLVKRGTIARREVNFSEAHLPPPADSAPPLLTESVEPRYRVRVQDTSAETEEDLIAAEEEVVVAADEKVAKSRRGGMGGGPLLALMSAGTGLSTVLSATEAFSGVTKVSGAQGDGLLSLIGVGLTAVAAMAVSRKLSRKKTSLLDPTALRKAFSHSLGRADINEFSKVFPHIEVKVEEIGSSEKAIEGRERPIIGILSQGIEQVMIAAHGQRKHPEGQWLWTPFLPQNIFFEGGRLFANSGAEFIWYSPSQLAIRPSLFSSPVEIDRLFTMAGLPSDIEELMIAGKFPVTNASLLKAYASDKISSHKIFEKSEIKSPRYQRFESHEKKSAKDLKSSLRKFIDEHGISSFVVKPSSGGRGRGVRMFQKSELPQAAVHAYSLAKAGEEILVEERIASYPMVVEGSRMDWNLRIVVPPGDLTGWDLMNTSTVRYSEYSGNPVNHSQGAKISNLNAFFGKIGFSSETRDTLVDKLRLMALKTRASLQKQLVDDSGEEKFDRHGQSYYSSSLLGLDIIVDADLNPFLIEMNAGSVGGIGGFAEVTEGEDKFKVSEIIVRNLIEGTEKGKSIPIAGEVVSSERNYFESADSWNNLAHHFLLVKEYDSAAACFELSFSMDPKRTDAWYNRGVAMGRLGRFTEAIHSYRQTLKIDPSRGDAWAGIGHSFVQLKKFRAAIKALDRAIAKNPRLTSAWGNKGVALSELGQNEEALRAFDKILEISPEHGETLNNRGAVLERLGRFSEALSSFDHALKLDPTRKETWNNKGGVLIRLGRFEESIKACDQALELDPNFANAWQHKGQALGLLERFMDAQAALLKAAELDPTPVRLAQILKLAKAITSFHHKPDGK